MGEKLDLKEASSKLFNPVDEKISARRLDDVNFMDLWYSIIHSAKRISFRDAHLHDKLVELVGAFKSHKIPGNEQYNYLYDALTDFSMACREAYNDSPAAYSGFFDTEVDAWANINFFFARVTVKSLEDLSIFAIWAMRQASETLQQQDDQSTALQKYDAYIPAAAVWVFGMGADLFDKEMDLTPADRKHGNPGKGGDLWKGKAEFSKERWAFWKERFAEIAKMGNVSERTKHIARDAIQHMERAETFERV